MTLSEHKPQQNRRPLLLFGAGGHGRADAALSRGQWSTVTASTRTLSAHLTELLPDVKLVELHTAIHLNNVALHVAIGNNAARQAEAQALGLNLLVTVIHALACVSAFSQIGAGSFVAAGAVIGPSAVLGLGVIVNHGAVINHDAEVGSFSHIAQRACVCGHAKLGQRVLIGSGAIVLSCVVLGDDLVLSAGAVASSDLLAPGVYSGTPAVKIE